MKSVSTLQSPVIVGSSDDPHVAAVVQACQDRRRSPSIVNVASFETNPYNYVARTWTIGNQTLDCDNTHTRGWVRRLAPPNWRAGVANDTHDGVVRASWLTLLSGWLGTEDIMWLTPIRALLRAENKLIQLDQAGKLGIRTPRTVVTNDPQALRRHGLLDVVVKPLGPAQFYTGQDDLRIVHATAMSSTNLTADELAAAPFLIQERIAARLHLRIVTVARKAWSAALDAAGLPLDWRSHPPAHDSFVPISVTEVEEYAVRLARRLGVGYTSQDWIIGQDGEAVFLDLNPAGQWLFLPDSVAQRVTNEIARWLVKEH